MDGSFRSLGSRAQSLARTSKYGRARLSSRARTYGRSPGRRRQTFFKDVSNAPASFAAARAGLAVGAMKGMKATLRDAESAYMQALLDTPTRTPAFVELPREWWPDSWFHDSSGWRKPKYNRPYRWQIRALYGHLEAGALWGKNLDARRLLRSWHVGLFSYVIYCVIVRMSAKFNSC